MTPGRTSGALTVRYLSVETASAYLSLSRKAIYHRVSRREIPFIKRGRRVMFDRLVLDRWMQEKVIDCDAVVVLHSARPTKSRQKRGVK